MQYKSFRIRNFKGIKDATVDLTTAGGAAVFAFVGLNESGKTTVLEAIHSFSPDTATSELVGGDQETGVPFNERVPRHLISTFSGDVSVRATLTATPTDKKRIIDAIMPGIS
jgi:predicted ATP-dependent endonuclease of OLD family